MGATLLEAVSLILYHKDIRKQLTSYVGLLTRVRHHEQCQCRPRIWKAYLCLRLGSCLWHLVLDLPYPDFNDTRERAQQNLICPHALAIFAQSLVHSLPVAPYCIYARCDRPRCGALVGPVHTRRGPLEPSSTEVLLEPHDVLWVHDVFYM